MKIIASKVNGKRLYLRARRKQLGYTQQSIADAVGISRSTYVNVETGTKDTSSNTWKNLSNILQSPVDKLWEQYYYKDNTLIGDCGTINGGNN